MRATTFGGHIKKKKYIISHKFSNGFAFKQIKTFFFVTAWCRSQSSSYFTFSDALKAPIPQKKNNEQSLFFDVGPSRQDVC